MADEWSDFQRAYRASARNVGLTAADARAISRNMLRSQRWVDPRVYSYEALDDMLKQPWEVPVMGERLDNSHQHTVRRNNASGTYDVIGPGGYYRACHHKAEAEAIAAFWSGDWAAATDARRRFLVARGLLEAESE